jgi:hypothetical protein
MRMVCYVLAMFCFALATILVLWLLLLAWEGPAGANNAPAGLPIGSSGILKSVGLCYYVR